GVLQCCIVGSAPTGFAPLSLHDALPILGPSRGSFFSSPRERNGPLPSRWATMFSASPDVMPETRASSGADAVLTSTPTPFTQSSTTASSERDKLGSASCRATAGTAEDG